MVVRENAIWCLRVRGEDEDEGGLLAVRVGDGGDELAIEGVGCGGSN